MLSDKKVIMPARHNINIILERQKSRLLKKLMNTFTKYYVCTLSSKPSCLELVPVEMSFLQIDASDTIIKP